MGGFTGPYTVHTPTIHCMYGKTIKSMVQWSNRTLPEAAKAEVLEMAKKSMKKVAPKNQAWIDE